MNTHTYRKMCLTCRQPEFNCYCHAIEKFDPLIKFVILIHPLEVRRRIATGRMSHLCLENSELIVGHNYSENTRVNRILESSENFCVILYPGQQSTNLTHLDCKERGALFPKDKKLVVFVVDGTWNTAKKMVRLSQNLNTLPQISFIPPAPSVFRVRKQPKKECFSTLEAIHHTIELIGPSKNFEINRGKHNNLLFVFNTMVEKQLVYVKRAVVRHVRKAI